MVIRLNGPFDRPLQVAVQLRRGRRGVGDEKHQHGRQIGLDHARALGDAQHPMPGRGARAAQLGVGVGGHHRPRHVQRCATREPGGQSGRGGAQGGYRQPPADYPGRRRQQLRRRQRAALTDRRQQGTGGSLASRSAHVGHPIVDHDAAYRQRVVAVAAHDLHRRAGDAVAGQERAPGTGRGRRQYAGQVNRQRLARGAQFGGCEVGGSCGKPKPLRYQRARREGRFIGRRRIVPFAVCFAPVYHFGSPHTTAGTPARAAVPPSDTRSRKGESEWLAVNSLPAASLCC